MPILCAAAALVALISTAVLPTVGWARGKDQPDEFTQRGKASYYAMHFAKRPMANGEAFDPQSDSAAHRTLPFGTVAEVRNLENGRAALVTIEDRGPFVPGRIIDLSPRTAARLGMLEDGVVNVEVTPVFIPLSR